MPTYFRSPQNSRLARSPALSSSAEQTLQSTAPSSTASRPTIVVVSRRRQTKTMATLTSSAPATRSPPAGDQRIICTSVRSGTVRREF
jgi:hypothetical protein